MKYEPTILELLLSRLAFCFYGKSVYKDFADHLPLGGNEYVLDFGCGMGTVAYYTAKRLPHGHLICADISQRWLSACRKTLRRKDNVMFLHNKPGFPALGKKSFDVAYCHYVLHDIPENELARVISALAECLKSSGILAFREPLKEAQKLSIIKRLAEQNGLSSKDSRITDVPHMGNALESIYIKL
jgi:SAM-dependent methyltransferase